MYNNIKTNWIAKNIAIYETIDSTQKEIWRKIESGNIENGTLVIAKTQSSGIGTHGRKWYANEEGNIIFSFVIKQNVSINKLENITLEIAEIFVEIFKKMYDISIEIKKPNDLMINNKKIGGILTESKVMKDIAEYIVIGVGINTNEKPKEEEVIYNSTSIKKEFNIDVDNYKVIMEFCNLFEKNFIERVEK